MTVEVLPMPKFERPDLAEQARRAGDELSEQARHMAEAERRPMPRPDGRDERPDVKRETEETR